jgi:hypothetical protein
VDERKDGMGREAHWQLIVDSRKGEDHVGMGFDCPPVELDLYCADPGEVWRR